jgi:hypothetical protein
MQPKGNFIELAASPTDSSPSPSDLDTLLLECSSVKLWLLVTASITQCSRRETTLIVIVSCIADAQETLRRARVG